MGDRLRHFHLHDPLGKQAPGQPVPPGRAPLHAGTPDQAERALTGVRHLGIGQAGMAGAIGLEQHAGTTLGKGGRSATANPPREIRAVISGTGHPMVHAGHQTLRRETRRQVAPPSMHYPRPYVT